MKPMPNQSAAAAGVPVMDTETRRAFEDAVAKVGPGDGAAVMNGLEHAASAARAAARHWDFCAPSKAIDDWLVETFGDRSPEEFHSLRKAAIAGLALKHFTPSDRLPDSVLRLYPAFFRRLSHFLTTGNTSYKTDFLCKDVRYALGLTVPCGLLQVDLQGRIGPKLALRASAKNCSPSALWKYATGRSWGRWYNAHMDPREISEFGRASWTKSIRCISDSLQLNSDVRGLVSVSWFYDPAISIHCGNLAFLREVQMDNGAFAFRLGPAAEHTRNALLGSPLRQRLYREGKYTPVGYMIAWPRNALIRWSENQSVTEAAEQQ